MRKNKSEFNNKNGLTLTELLVASVLVGIIMVGIVSFNFALKRIENTSSSKSVLSAQATAFMSMITIDAEKAVGDFDSSGVSSFGPSCICFRHNADGNPDYQGDVWTCYSEANNQISRKTFGDTEGNGVIPDSAASCSTAGGGARVINNLLNINPTSFFTIPGGCDDCAADGQNAMSHIEIKFTAIRDPNNAPDPLRNPTVELQTKINPMGHGRN